ncbi:MAG: VWA domain-containing protein [Burkholderiales bacterium]
MHFARVLRGAGIPVGTGKLIDATHALALAGVASRADWHATLSALFLTRHEQQAVFDQAFEVFWRDPALEEKMMALLLPKVRGRAPPPEDGIGPRVAAALLPRREPRPPPEEGPDELRVDATLTFSPGERLRRADFEKMTAGEWVEARRVVSRLALPLPPVATRRYRPDARGSAVDLAATLRRMAREGGGIATVARRSRRRRAPPLVVLCDISGSMHRYSRMFLHFLHALASRRDRVSVFLFGTRLTNVTRQLRGRDADEAVSRASDAVGDWAGGTRIGACLREFNWRWSRRLLGQNACVLLVTDGLDRDDESRLGEEMARLARSCRRLVWLNPLLRYEGFEPRASGIRAMRPHADEFLPAHNIDSLRDLGLALAAPPPPRHGLRYAPTRHDPDHPT